jgi:peptidoglycan/xylan/chitin deacetylase (PgdA/CDA1 family)
LKTLLKKALLSLPGFQPLCRRLTRNHVRVLMYHRFSAAGTPQENRPDAQTLAWQMAVVKAHHPTWTVARHHAAVTGERPIDESCPVVVTVDDGYADFRDVAHPVFQAHGVPVIVFITTGFVDGQFWLWWDRLAYIFEHADPTSTWVDVGDERHRLDLSSDDSRHATWHRIGIRCCFLPEDRKQSLLEALAERLGVAIPASPPEQYVALNWDDLRALRGQGVDFGAHTVTHTILTRVPLAAARVEIRESKRMLEQRLGEVVPWFCYPQGGPADYSPEVVAEVAAAGYATAYLAFTPMPGTKSLFTLPRWNAPTDATEFLWILSGAARLELNLNRLLRRDTGPGQAYWAGAEGEAR